jgi:LysM repeat protein
MNQETQSIRSGTTINTIKSTDPPSSSSSSTWTNSHRIIIESPSGASEKALKRYILEHADIVKRSVKPLSLLSIPVPEYFQYYVIISCGSVALSMAAKMIISFIPFSLFHSS